MVKKIDQNEFKAMDKSGIVLVDFNATWCGPCKMLAPILEELSEEYATKASFYSIDTDENQEMAIEYGIMSIPALVLFKDGVKADMSVGFVPKAQLESFIGKYL